MTQHDFKKALKKLDAGDGLSPDDLTAIRSAMRIAERLQSGEVSEEIMQAGASHKWSGGYDRNGSHDNDKCTEYTNSMNVFGEVHAPYACAEVFRAMAQQLIKECE